MQTTVSCPNANTAVRGIARFSHAVVFICLFPDICAVVKCPQNKQCFPQPGGGSDCRCPVEHECSSSGDEVCGSDAVTYDSECHLKAKACRSPGSKLVVVTKGPCGTSDSNIDKHIRESKIYGNFKKHLNKFFFKDAFHISWLTYTLDFVLLV